MHAVNWFIATVSKSISHAWMHVCNISSVHLMAIWGGIAKRRSVYSQSIVFAVRYISINIYIYG